MINGKILRSYGMPEAKQNFNQISFGLRVGVQVNIVAKVVENKIVL